VPLRAVDFHVHLPTPDWLDVSMAGYVEAAEAYFRSPVQRQSLEELAVRYRDLRVKAVLLAWDAETATGRPRVPNETVAQACRDYPDAFTGLGSVDPHKGEAAVAEVANIAALGLRGVKFHPSLQAFSPNDPQYWPIFAACEQHGLLALFHTGTSGIGAGQPGGQGIRLDYAHPLKLDPVAAAHPGLTIVAAHFGWPWHLDLTAIALFEQSDLSGFSGRVSDSGEGRWTITAAIDESAPAPVLSAALYQRFSSRGEEDFADKLLSAMRYQFGGHVEHKN